MQDSLKFHIGAAIIFLSHSANWYAYLNTWWFLLSSVFSAYASFRSCEVKKPIFSWYKSNVIISSLGLFFLYSPTKESEILNVLDSPSGFMFAFMY